MGSFIQPKRTREIIYLQTISSLGTYNPGPTQVGGLISTCASCIEGGRPSDRLYNNKKYNINNGINPTMWMVVHTIRQSMLSNSQNTDRRFSCSSGIPFILGASLSI